MSPMVVTISSAERASSVARRPVEVLLDEGDASCKRFSNRVARAKPLCPNMQAPRFAGRHLTPATPRRGVERWPV
jgi:hypothetical protein